MDRAFAVLEESCVSQEICGAVAAVVAGHQVVGPRAFGRSSLVPEGPKLDADAIFDLASLTKVVATLPCVLRLVAAGEVRLDQEAGCFLPELAGTGPGRATLLELLTHTSGLSAHYPFYRENLDRAGLLKFIGGMPLLPRGQVVYSDIGFILLGFIVEQVLGAGLDQEAARTVFSPLGMDSTGFGLTGTSRAVATELGVPAGVVHDENARAMGGVAGHAGLFSSAPDLVRYARVWLDHGTPLLDSWLVAMATRDCTGGQGRGLGWFLPGPGSVFPPAGYGHTGFTGTSLWLDPRPGLAVILLTNAVHPARGNPATPRVRRDFHRAVYEWACREMGGV
ncbi:MAG: serine hydrolase domain-containing protein [Bacillota bacterium]